MKTIETEYDEAGWKLKILKNKESTQIYLRSKYGHHNMHKRFYLRLTNKRMKQLKEMLAEIE